MRFNDTEPERTARSHLGTSYQELSAFGDRVRQQLERSVRDTGPYAKSQIALRLTQRVLDLIHVDYLSARRDGVPVRESALLGGLRVDFSTGTVKPTLRTVLRSFAVFVRLWLYLLIGASLPGKQRRGPATLILGLRQRDILHGGSARSFLAFCDEGRVVPLAEAEHFVIQDRVDTPLTEVRLCVSRNALLRSMTFASKTWSIRFLLDHFVSACRYVSGAIHCTAFCLLERDFAEHSVAASLSRACGLRDVVLTNTWFAEQPLWATSLPDRTFRTHLVFYSMMGRAFAYRNIATPPMPLPGFALMRADTFWVWTRGQAEMLREMNVQGEARITGPLIWRPRRLVSGNGNAVAIFDVAPALPRVADRLGLSHNYYSVENCIAFLDHVVAAAAALQARLGRTVPVLLKHKRPFASLHDSRYIDHVAALCNHGVLEAVDTDADFYQLLERSFAAVVMPFSSPAYVASDAGLSAAYYDPSGELVPTFESAERIYFAGRRDALMAFLEMAMHGKARSPAGTEP